MKTSPYRESVALVATPRWASPWARFVVRAKRFVFWTLAARRKSWRDGCRYLERLDRGAIKTGLHRVSITATNGSVVKNVYVDHGRLDMHTDYLLDSYRRYGHEKMPKT